MPSARANKEENQKSDINDSKVEPAERVLNRTEIAELAQTMMPKALKKIETLLHNSGSDLAALQAFRALKDAAYGKDPQVINAPMDFESLTDDELKSAIAAELGPDFTAGGADVEDAEKTPPAGEPD